MVRRKNSRYTVTPAIIAVLVWIPVVCWFLHQSTGPEFYTIESTRAALIGRLDSLSGYDLKRSLANIDSPGVYISISGSPCLNQGSADRQVISSISSWNDTVKPRLIRAGKKPEKYGCPKIKIIFTVDDGNEKLAYFSYFLVPFSEFYQENFTLVLQSVKIFGENGGYHYVNSSILSSDENRRLKRIFEDSVLNKLNVKWEDQRLRSFLGG